MSQPLIFKTLTVKNFLSYGQQEVEFDLNSGDIVSVLGRNLDTGGDGSSNGAGKTTIINALCYALYNKPFDNISLQRLINSTNATKNTLMEVRLVMEKGGDEYEIYRARGEEYRIAITRNGDDVTPGKGVTECDEVILDIVGISYELFTRTVIFSGNSPAFLQLPIGQQRTQIEELFNITMLSEKAHVLRERIRTTEGDIKVQEVVIKQQETAVEVHERHVVDAEQRVIKWERTRQADIAQIEATLTSLSTVDFGLEQELHAERDLHAQALAVINTQRPAAKRDVETQQRQAEKLATDIEHLENDHCPYCKQAFAEAGLKLEALYAAAEEAVKKLAAAEELHQRLEQEGATLQANLAGLRAAIKHENLDQLLKARENVSVLNARLSELRDAINPHIEAAENLKAEQVRAPDYLVLDALKRRLEHQAFLLKLLTDKGSFLRKRIINKTIPFLNGRLNHYTQTLGLPHIVKFDADMSCTVCEFGRELDFGNLSAGEKKRVNTAMALAFRDVMHHLHARTNLMILDELDGALDPNGIDSVIRVLKDKSRDEDTSVFVISHHPNILGRLDRTLVIEKENGFSTAYYE